MNTAWRRSGFSLAELTVILAVIGTLFALSIPAFLNYYQTAQVRGAAADVTAYLNQGRQLAIQLNCSVAVQITGTAISYVMQANCQNGTWTGAGTDALGNIGARRHHSRRAAPCCNLKRRSSCDSHRHPRHQQPEHSRLGLRPRDRRTLIQAMRADLRVHSALTAVHSSQGTCRPLGG
jgi:Tfp pilus assembly protein FimT